MHLFLLRMLMRIIAWQVHVRVRQSLLSVPKTTKSDIWSVRNRRIHVSVSSVEVVCASHMEAKLKNVRRFNCNGWLIWFFFGFVSVYIWLEECAYTYTLYTYSCDWMYDLLMRSKQWGHWFHWFVLFIFYFVLCNKCGTSPTCSVHYA